MLRAGSSRVRVPMRSLNFFNLPNPSSRTMALEFTQPLTETSTSGLVIKVPGYRSRGPDSIPSATRFSEK
jgi:hypothetical protein